MQLCSLNWLELCRFSTPASPLKVELQPPPYELQGQYRLIAGTGTARGDLALLSPSTPTSDTMTY